LSVCVCACVCFRRNTTALELDKTRMKTSGALGRLYRIAVVLNATSDNVGSMLTEDRSVIFRSICLFVGHVCLWMDAFLDAVRVCVCLFKRLLPSIGPLAAPWHSLSSKGSAVLNRSPCLLSTGCAFILSSTIQNTLVGSVHTVQPMEQAYRSGCGGSSDCSIQAYTLCMMKGPIMMMIYIYIYMYKRRLCYWCVCKSRYFADPQTKRISIYGIL
jgi:hypothetical protein